MALSDCVKCWDTPCTCGWHWRNWSKAGRIKFAARVLGVEASVLEKIEIPERHPMTDDYFDPYERLKR